MKRSMLNLFSKPRCLKMQCSVNVLTTLLTPLPSSFEPSTEQRREQEKEEENFLISSLRQMTCFRRRPCHRLTKLGQPLSLLSPPLRARCSLPFSPAITAAAAVDSAILL